MLSREITDPKKCMDISLSPQPVIKNFIESWIAESNYNSPDDCIGGGQTKASETQWLCCVQINVAWYSVKLDSVFIKKVLSSPKFEFTLHDSSLNYGTPKYHIRLFFSELEKNLQDVDQSDMEIKEKEEYKKWAYEYCKDHGYSA